MRTLGIVALALAVFLFAVLAASRASSRKGGAGRASAAAGTTTGRTAPMDTAKKDSSRVVKSEEEWKRLLDPEQFQVLRCSATEPPFTGKYWNEHRRGTYRCAACGEELYSSDTKFDSGTGWPSFWAPILDGNVEVVKDTSYGIVRDEVRCARCGSHLGHVFEDGPEPTGLRFCMNSTALEFVPAEK